MKRFYKFLMPLVAIVAMALPWNANAQLTTIVADSTTTNSYVPLYGLWMDSYTRSQCIYPATMLTDLNPGDQITSLTFFSSDASYTYGSAAMDVKLGEVTETTMSSYLTYTATTVYSGAVEVSGNQMVITFTDPYIYQGGNLVVEFFQTATGTYHSTYFYGVNATGASASGYNSGGASSATFNQRNFLPKVEIEYVPGTGDICYAIRNLSVSAITDEGATLLWMDTLNNGAATYTIISLPDSTVLASGLNDTTYTLTGLNSDTVYQVAVYGDCGFGTSNARSISFRTACSGYTNVPYTEGFEGYETGDLPGCWQVLSTGASGSGTFPSIYNYSSNTHTGSGYFEFESTTASAVEMVALPEMQNISGLSLTMWVASSSSYPCSLEVGVMEDTVFVPVDTLNLITFSGGSNWSQNYHEYTVYFPNYTGSGERIALRAVGTGSGQYTLFVDDLSVNEFSGCYPISSVSVSDVQSASAIVSWVDNLNSSATYRLFWSDGTNVDSADVTNDNTYTLLNLDASTDYTVTVVVVCGDGSYTSPATTTFHTDCDGGGCDIVISMTDSWGDGWNGNAIVGTHNGQTIFSATLTGGNNGTFTYHTCAADTVVLTWSTGSYPDETGFVITVGGSPVASGNGDDFTSGAVIGTVNGCPSCLAPSALTLDSVGIDAATFHWSGNASSYRVYWSDGTTTDSIDVYDNFYTLTTLTPSTNYTVAVAAICDGGELSMSISGTFRTECADGSCEVVINMTDSFGDGWNGHALNGIVNGVSTFVATLTDGSNGTYSYSQCSTDTLALTWTTGSYPSEVSFTISVGGAQILNAGGNDYSENDVVVTLMGCPACPAPSNLAVDSVTSDEITIHWTVGDEETEWNVIVNDSVINNITSNPYTITGLEQYTYYTISVSAVCSDGGNSFTSNAVTVRTAVACPWPTNFVANSYGDTVDFAWDNAASSSWELVYGPMGFDPSTSTDGVSLSTNSYQVTGLTTGFYDAYIRTDCGSDYSIWVGPVNFTIGVTIMNMATSGTDTLQTCAAIIYDNGGPSSEYSSSCNSTLILLPDTPGSEIVVSGTSYTEGSYDYLTIYEGVGTTGTVLWTDNGSYNNESFGPFTAPAITVTFVSDASLNYSGFQINAGCTEPSDCPRPTYFACTSVAADSVVVEWSGTGASSYQLAVGAPGFNPDTVTTIVTSDSSYFFANLTAGTSYEMYVRADCGTSTSNWTGPITVTPGQYIIGTSGSDTINMCGGVIYDNGGPTGDYSLSSDYTLVVYPSHPDSLVTFHGSAYLESNTWDYLRIYEGVGTSGTLLWENPNSTQASTIAPDTSLVGPITLHFQSDSYGVYSGFELFINCVAAPSCLRPYSISVASVTANSVTVNMNGTASAYKLYIADATGALVDSASTTATTHTFTGLTPLTTYTVTVASDCGTELSDFIGVTTTTTMVAATLPYSTGFEAGDDVAWMFVNGTETNQWFIDTAVSNSGASALYISNDNGVSNAYNASSSSNVFVYKTFSFDSIGDYAVSYDWLANGESCCDYLRVFLAPGNTEFTAGSMGVISSTGTPTGWYSLDGGSKLNQSSSWQNHSEIFSITTPGNYNLVFFWHNDGSVGTNPPAAVDNVQAARLSCPAPQNLTLDASDMTSLTFHWTPAGSESAWEVTVGTTTAIATTNSFTATGLSSSSSYNVSVRAICGVGDTSFVTSANFATSCGVISTFPYAESFESAEAPANCWTLVYGDGSGTTNPMTHYSGSAHDGNRVFRFSSYSSSSDYNQYLISPELSGSNLILSFWYMNYSSYGDDNIQVGYSTTTADTSAFIWGSWLNPGGNWTEFVDTMPANVKYFAIHYYGDYAYYTYVDDLTVDGNGSGCNAPDAVNATAAETTATLTWSGSANAYQVAVVAGNWVEPTAPVSVTGSSYTFTGLTPGTQYSLGVRSDCDSGLYSQWVVTTVTTAERPCPVPTDVHATATTVTSATIAWTPAEEGQTDFQLHITTPGADTLVDATGSSVTVTGLLANTAYTVTVRANCGAGVYSEWSAPATFTTNSCPDVTNVHMGTITTTTATVLWEGTADSYEVAYGEQGTTTEQCERVTTTSTSYTITGLESGSIYVVYVRSICGGGAYGEWADETTFTTAEENGIDDIDNANISLYPNPASSTVTLTGIEGAAKVTVVDMNGREVANFEIRNSKFEFDVSGMTQGAYFVRITGEQVNAIRKLIVR